MEKSVLETFLLPRHLQLFWGASGDFWQACWEKFLAVTGE